MSDLDDLLAGLTGATTTTETEVVAAAAPAAAENVSLDDLLGDAQSAPAAETTAALDVDLASLLDDVQPAAAATPAVAAPVATSQKKVGKKKEGKKPESVKTEQPAAGDATEKTEEGEKKERQARIFFAKKTDRLRHRLGDKIAEYTLRELPDTDELTDEMVMAEKDACLAEIDALGVKPQNRATMIVEYLAGKTATLNSVIADAFKLLHAEGKVEMGVSGNLLKVLASRYSSGSARAMGGNTLIAMRTLKIIDANGALNPRSLIYPAIVDKLGLATEAEEQKAA